MNNGMANELVWVGGGNTQPRVLTGEDHTFPPAQGTVTEVAIKKHIYGHIIIEALFAKLTLGSGTFRTNPL